MNVGKWSLPMALVTAALSPLPLQAAKATDEFRQFQCILDNDWVGFELRKTSEMGDVGARTYIVDFQQNGPTIRLPPEYYAPDWPDIEEITFQFVDSTKAEGRLSLRINNHSQPAYTQPIGILQRSCWEAAKQFLQGQGIARPIKEIMRGQSSN